jgi:hypothetical protein
VRDKIKEESKRLDAMLIKTRDKSSSTGVKYAKWVNNGEIEKRRI